MYLLGYDIDFGYLEAVNLMSSIKFQEKLIVRKGLGLHDFISFGIPCYFITVERKSLHDPFDHTNSSK